MLGKNTQLDALTLEEINRNVGNKVAEIKEEV
jgi:hypothetical protein